MAITRYGRTKTLIWFFAGSLDSIAVAVETKWPLVLLWGSQAGRRQGNRISSKKKNIFEL